MSGTIRVDLRSPTVTVEVPSTGVRVGFPGPQGPPGETTILDIQGTLPDGNPPGSPGAQPGDAWIDPTGGFWVWDGSEWVHISGSVTNLNDLTDVDTAGAASGQVLGYDGSLWVPVEPAAGGSGSVDWANADPITVRGDLLVPIFTHHPTGDTYPNFMIESHTGTGGYSFSTTVNELLPPTPALTLDTSGAIVIPKGDLEIDKPAGYLRLTGTNGQAVLQAADGGGLTVNGERVLLEGDATGGGGASDLDDLTDVDTGTIAPVAGQLLGFDGALWVPVDAPTGGGGTGGDYLPLTGGTVTGQVTVQHNVPLVLKNAAASGQSSLDVSDNGNLRMIVPTNGYAQFTTPTQSKVQFRQTSSAGENVSWEMQGAGDAARIYITGGSNWNFKKVIVEADLAGLQAEVESLRGKVAMLMDLMGLGEEGAG